MGWAFLQCLSCNVYIKYWKRQEQTEKNSRQNSRHSVTKQRGCMSYTARTQLLPSSHLTSLDGTWCDYTICTDLFCNLWASYLSQRPPCPCTPGPRPSSGVHPIHLPDSRPGHWTPQMPLRLSLKQNSLNQRRWPLYELPLLWEPFINWLASN